MVSDSLLKSADGSWKVNKRGRDEVLLLLAQTVIDPAEVWTQMTWHANQQQTIEGQHYMMVVIFRREDLGNWVQITAHRAESNDELAKKIAKNRTGVRLYRRDK